MVVLPNERVVMLLIARGRSFTNRIHALGQGVEGQTPSPQAVTMSYGLDHSPFFIVCGMWGGKWRRIWYIHP